MFKPDQDGIYARVRASKARALFSYGVFGVLGVLVLAVAVLHPPEFVWLVFLLAFGGLMLWLGETQRRAANIEIRLTEDAVVDSTGRVLAQMDDIQSVSRGALAIKPSHGFTLVTRVSGARAYVPGMWWRIGRRVGVGGITGAGETKFMAEQIALRIKQRDT